MFSSHRIMIPLPLLPWCGFSNMVLVLVATGSSTPVGFGVPTFLGSSLEQSPTAFNSLALQHEVVDVQNANALANERYSTLLKNARAHGFCPLLSTESEPRNLEDEYRKAMDAVLLREVGGTEKVARKLLTDVRYGLLKNQNPENYLPVSAQMGDALMDAAKRAKTILDEEFKGSSENAEGLGFNHLWRVEREGVNMTDGFGDEGKGKSTSQQLCHTTTHSEDVSLSMEGLLERLASSSMDGLGWGNGNRCVLLVEEGPTQTTSRPLQVL